MSACGTISRFRSDPVPAIEPVVYPASCLADPVEAQPVEAPPIPPAIERPAGEPNARNYPDWLAYATRRMERAELAGLYFQGQADSYSQAFHLTEEQLRQCVTFVRNHNGDGQ